jgi:hypothetical protein
MCALLTGRLCVYEDVLKRCVLKRCMQMWHFTLERDLTRTSKILALMSTHLVQRRKKQLFYVCFNLCFKEMWWYMCNVKFYALRARSRRRYQYMLKYYYNHVKDNFINFKTSWTTRISLNSSTVEILFFFNTTVVTLGSVATAAAAAGTGTQSWSESSSGSCRRRHDTCNSFRSRLISKGWLECLGIRYYN